MFVEFYNVRIMTKLKNWKLFLNGQSFCFIKFVFFNHFYCNLLIGCFLLSVKNFSKFSSTNCFDKLEIIINISPGKITQMGHPLISKLLCIKFKKLFWINSISMKNRNIFFKILWLFDIKTFKIDDFDWLWVCFWNKYK